MFKTTPKLLFIMSVVLAVTGCSKNRPQVKDGQMILNGLGAPEVKTMAQTMEENAKSAIDRGEYSKAGQIYRQLSDMKPEKVEYHIAFADAARRAGELDMALNAYEKILKKDVNNIDALEGRGLALLAKGEFKEAGEVLSQVKKKDATRWKALNGLGLLFVQKQMYPESILYFQEALRQKGDRVTVLNNLGLAQAISSLPVEATQSLTQASAASGENKLLRQQVDMNLALVYAIMGKLDVAEKISAQYLSGSALDNNLALYAHLAKDDTLAKGYLNMALAKSPRYYARAWTNLETLSKDGESSAPSKAMATGSMGSLGKTKPEDGNKAAKEIKPLTEIKPTKELPKKESPKK